MGFLSSPPCDERKELMSGIIFEEALRSRRAAAVVGAVLVALALALWAGPTGAQECPPGEPFCGGPNVPPDVDADDASVVVVQGQTATNTGTYSDEDTLGNNDVDITASVGNVTKDGTSSGTWSWSLANAAPLGRQQVTITATDSLNGSSTTEFTLTVTRPNGKIAFRSPPDEIYTMNPDGSGQTNLTNVLGIDDDPAFSPDGNRIAFTTTRDDPPGDGVITNYEVYVMNSDGTGQTRLTDNPAFDGVPSFSPDGSRIAFASFRDGNSEIYVMNADGTGQTNLTNHSALDTEPAFSPDGTKIAFVRNGNIYVMNVDGTGQTPLTSSGGFDPAFSPDGSRIAFTSSRTTGTGVNNPEGDLEIFTMNLNGTGITQLTFNTANDVHPAFSPDGTKIAFASFRDGGGSTELYVMDADGTDQTRLTFNPGGDGSPSWGAASDAAPPPADTTAPEVESVSPTDGATKVPRLTNVTATFSEKMDPSTLSASTVTLKNTKTGQTVTDVGVTTAENSEGKTVLTLNPFPSNAATKLAKKTKYEVRITTGAKDLPGNPLATDKVWSFTTGRK